MGMNFTACKDQCSDAGLALIELLGSKFTRRYEQ